MSGRVAALKQQIEAQLAQRIPAALSPMARQEVVRLPMADARLNDLLGGGVPVGAITEVHGAACSGRTSFALSLASAVTEAGSVVAWVDVSDALDPEAAALCGVDLERLLWVRCGAPTTKPADTSALDKRKQEPGTTVAAVAANAAVSQAEASPNLVAANHTPRPVGNGGCGSPHPRGEGRGMAEAIDSLLQAQPRSAAMKQRREQKIIGTPGAPNRDVMGSFAEAVRNGSTVSHSIGTVLDKASAFPSGKTAGNIVSPSEIVPTGSALFGRQVERKVSCGSNRLSLPLPPTSQQRPAMPFPNASPYREEQIPTDRQPSRRAAQQNTSTEPKVKPRSAMRGLDAPRATTRSTATGQDTWAPLDQALRAMDLLLQAGGFSLLVLDLGNVPANVVWRIPLATWFRFRAGCERSRSSLLVVSQHPCARASADLTVAMELGSVQSVGGTVGTGSAFRLQVEQQRRSTGIGPEPAGKVVPFRKPPRADHDTRANAHQGGTWTAGAPWSIRA